MIRGAVFSEGEDTHASCTDSDVTIDSNTSSEFRGGGGLFMKENKDYCIRSDLLTKLDFCSGQKFEAKQILIL